MSEPRDSRQFESWGDVLRAVAFGLMLVMASFWLLIAIGGIGAVWGHIGLAMSASGPNMTRWDALKMSIPIALIGITPIGLLLGFRFLSGRRRKNEQARGFEPVLQGNKKSTVRKQ